MFVSLMFESQDASVAARRGRSMAPQLRKGTCHRSGSTGLPAALLPLRRLVHAKYDSEDEVVQRFLCKRPYRDFQTARSQAMAKHRPSFQELTSVSLSLALSSFFLLNSTVE